MKTCNRCEQDKPDTEFSRKAAAKDGLQSSCKECTRSYFQGWYSTNGDAVRLRAREWAQENPEANRARAVQWNRDNKDRHRLRAKKFKHIRRALEKATATGTIDLRSIWDEQAGICSLCDHPMIWELEHPDPLSKSVDHVIPISRGGGHVQENVKWAHLECNLRKGAKV